MTTSLTTPLPELLTALDRLDLAVDTKRKAHDLAVVCAEEDRPLNLDQLLAAVAEPLASKGDIATTWIPPFAKDRPRDQAMWEQQVAHCKALQTRARKRFNSAAVVFMTLVGGLVTLLLTGCDLGHGWFVAPPLLAGVLGWLGAQNNNIATSMEKLARRTPVRVSDDDMRRWRQQPSTRFYLERHVDPHAVPLMQGDVAELQHLDVQEKAFREIDLRRAQLTQALKRAD